MVFVAKTTPARLLALLLMAQLLFTAQVQAETLSSSVRVTQKDSSADKATQEEGKVHPPIGAPGSVSSSVEAGGSSFLLPFDANLKTLNDSPETAKTPLYQAEVSKVDIDSDFGGQVGELLDAALYKDTKLKTLNQQIAHYRNHNADYWAQQRDFGNYLLPLRGDSGVVEVSDVLIKGETVKAKNKAAAEYAKQRKVDEVHAKIVSAMMEMAMGLGLKDTNRSQQVVNSGLNSLRQLVGDKEAEDTLDKLATWTKQTVVPAYVYKQPRWDVSLTQEKLKDTCKIAFEGDPIMTDIVNKVKAYHERATKRGMSSVAPTAFTVLEWLTPGIILPAGIALLESGYMNSTGGTPERKLLNELYYDKRMESRWRVINEEAQMALSQYQNALATHNRTLLVASESLISQLVGAENVNSIISKPVLAHVPPPPPRPVDAKTMRRKIYQDGKDDKPKPTTAHRQAIILR